MPSSPSHSKIHHHTSLSVPETLGVGCTELSTLTRAPVDLQWGNGWLQRNLHEIKFSTWLTRVTRPGLPTCSFIIPGLITDWTGCLDCLMPAQLLHGRNGLVTLRYNTLYYHLHFIYLSQISHTLQATCPPQRHLQFTTAQPSTSFRKLFRKTCLKFSLKCHLDVTPIVWIESNKGDLNCSFSYHISAGGIGWQIFLNVHLLWADEKALSSCINYKKKKTTDHNKYKHWDCWCWSDSKLCFPAFMSIELKVSAWGHCMIER